jgi:hypothetical protein
MEGRHDRRAFLLGGGALVLAGLTAGALGAPRDAASAEVEGRARVEQKGAGMVARTASFGWELSNLDNNGADAYFKVTRRMTLSFAEVDVAFMITTPPASPGFAEVLCTASVSRGRRPTFSAGPQAYDEPPVSADFGTVQLYNPNNLTGPFNRRLGQDAFLAVILKSWVPTDGTGSHTARHVRTEPALTLDAGDYLVFHMDHAGVSGDAEMQVVLGYTEGSVGS